MQKSTPPFDRHAVLRFMETHGLTFAEFVRHAGIGYHTGRRVLTEGGQPQAATAARIMSALDRLPAIQRPACNHTDIVRAWWGSDASDDIGRRCVPKISGARVRAIAKKLGLPPGGTRARKRAAE